jgi:hypothetical protein
LPSSCKDRLLLASAAYTGRPSKRKTHPYRSSQTQQ